MEKPSKWRSHDRRSFKIYYPTFYLYIFGSKIRRKNRAERDICTFYQSHAKYYVRSSVSSDSASFSRKKIYYISIHEKYHEFITILIHCAIHSRCDCCKMFVKFNVFYFIFKAFIHRKRNWFPLALNYTNTHSVFLLRLIDLALELCARHTPMVIVMMMKVIEILMVVVVMVLTAALV